MKLSYDKSIEECRRLETRLADEKIAKAHIANINWILTKCIRKYTKNIDIESLETQLDEPLSDELLSDMYKAYDSQMGTS